MAGKIFRNSTTLISDANFSHFNIGIESVVPISYHGIPIRSLSGNIESEKGITRHFPQVEMANGSGVLLFEELSENLTELRSNLIWIMQTISTYQFFAKADLMDLKLNILLNQR